MKVDLKNQNFGNIRVENTNLYGGNFAKCNLSNTQFKNVNINGINLNGAKLFGFIWQQLRINDLYQLDGHTRGVLSVCFSPDGNTLASGSVDKSIGLWDVKTGQQKAKLDGHTHYVYSVCFSLDGNFLASEQEIHSSNIFIEKFLKMQNIPFLMQSSFRFLFLDQISYLFMAYPKQNILSLRSSCPQGTVYQLLILNTIINIKRKHFEKVYLKYNR
ncbi:unnamed protein product [Paramecium pentaurelia]|uniref:Uncharacterized protein n=1 Tax=Paramecium pentaurelia TaxID=43138 RepID=A0A8S1WWC8_9CILI|nr:unnamed protein product [Paramecium pentaurelia]